MGFGGYGLGARIPSTQERIEEKTETDLLIKQVKASVRWTFFLFAVLYVILNLMFGWVDMLDVVLGIQASFCTAIYFFMNFLFGRYTTGTIELWKNPRDGRVAVLKTSTVSFVLSVILWIAIAKLTAVYFVSVFQFPAVWLSDFWGSLARPLTYAAIAFFFALLSPVLAFWNRLITKEIVDQYHSPAEVARTWAQAKADVWKAKALKELEEGEVEDDVVDGELVDTTSPSQLRIAPVATPKMTAEQRNAAAIKDFIRGVADGLWTTARNTYEAKGVTLNGSGLPLTRNLVDTVIKPWLIRNGYAKLDNPNMANSSWSFLYEPSFILDFMDGKTKELSQNRKIWRIVREENGDVIGQEGSSTSPIDSADVDAPDRLP